MSAKSRVRLPNKTYKSLVRWAHSAASEDTPVNHILGIVLARLSELGPAELDVALTKIKEDKDWPAMLDEIGPPDGYED